MSYLLLQTGGKAILLDAGLGAPFSQLLPKLKEKGVTPEELQLIYITHLLKSHKYHAIIINILSILIIFVERIIKY